MLRRTVLTAIALAALGGSLSAQDNPPKPRPRPQPTPPVVVTPAKDPLPPGVLARVNGRDVTLEEYKDFLYRERLLDRLMKLVDDVLIEKKAEGLGVKVTDQEVADVVDRQIQTDIERAYRGDKEKFVAALGRRMRTIESHRLWMIQQYRRRLLIDRCIVKLRTIDDEAVRKAFVEIYGKDGVHYQVRHILLRKPRSRVEGAPTRDLQAEAQRIMEELEKDPSQFVALVQAHSEDPLTQGNEGFIPSYREQLYGPHCHDVVQALDEEGAIGGPVESGFGVHIFQLVKKTVTRFEDVQSEIREELRHGQPTGDEIARFLKELREDATIEM